MVVVTMGTSFFFKTSFFYFFTFVAFHWMFSFRVSSLKMIYNIFKINRSGIQLIKCIGNRIYPLCICGHKKNSVQYILKLTFPNFILLPGNIGFLGGFFCFFPGSIYNIL